MTMIISNFVHINPETREVVIKLNYVNQMFSLEIIDHSGVQVLKQNITGTEQVLEKKLEPGVYIFRILENNIITKEQTAKIPQPTALS